MCSFAQGILSLNWQEKIKTFLMVDVAQFLRLSQNGQEAKGEGVEGNTRTGRRKKNKGKEGSTKRKWKKGGRTVATFVEMVLDEGNIHTNTKTGRGIDKEEPSLL